MVQDKFKNIRPYIGEEEAPALARIAAKVGNSFFLRYKKREKRIIDATASARISS